MAIPSYDVARFQLALRQINDTIIDIFVETIVLTGQRIRKELLGELRSQVPVDTGATRRSLRVVIRRRRKNPSLSIGFTNRTIHFIRPRIDLGTQEQLVRRVETIFFESLEIVVRRFRLNNSLTDTQTKELRTSLRDNIKMNRRYV